jgi:hypothetical protein
VSRATFDVGEQWHWVALDPSGARIVFNSDEHCAAETSNELGKRKSLFEQISV